LHHEFLLAQQVRKKYVDAFDLPEVRTIPHDASADIPPPRTRIQKAVDEFDAYR
jgi:hypothetical protein